MPHRIAQAVNGSIAVLSRGDLAGRLAATLNKWLKRPGFANSLPKLKMREDPTKDPGPPPRYRWSETWPGEGHRDYRGWDGSRPFGRIMYENAGPTKNLWRWSINHIDGVKKHLHPHNGWEPSPRLAAQRVEEAYEQLMALNSIPLLSTIRL